MVIGEIGVEETLNLPPVSAIRNYYGPRCIQTVQVELYFQIQFALIEQVGLQQQSDYRECQGTYYCNDRAVQGLPSRVWEIVRSFGLVSSRPCRGVTDCALCVLTLITLADHLTASMYFVLTASKLWFTTSTMRSCLFYLRVNGCDKIQLNLQKFFHKHALLNSSILRIHLY